MTVDIFNILLGLIRKQKILEWKNKDWKELCRQFTLFSSDSHLFA